LSSSLLTPVQTRSWMKPHTSTSSEGFLMGGPWEILRSTTVTKDQRLVEFYCKSGNLNTFNNMLCLIPDYDLVITILSGGQDGLTGKGSSPTVVDGLLDAVVTAIVPAVEDVGKTAAGLNFAGTYTDAATNSSLTIATDDGPGFEVSAWYVRDVPTVLAVASLKGSAAAAAASAIRVRLYPTNLYSYNKPPTTSPPCVKHKKRDDGADAASGKTYRQSWRAVFDQGKPEELQAVDENRFWPMASCHTWGSLDRNVYQFRGIDDFVFEIDEQSGKAVALDLRGFKVLLKREE